MPTAAHRLCLFFVLVGAGLRLAQYVGTGSQTMDELAVSQNIVERSLAPLLTKPLAYDQSAPKGFLLVEKLAATALGASDRALHIFPLLCSLAALWGFWRLSERVLPGWGAPVAVALLAFAGPLINYSAQVKQYSSDVMVTVFILWAAVDLVERGADHAASWRAALAGAIGVWFSQPAVLLLAGLGGVLVLRSWRSVERPPLPWGVLAVWGVSAALATLVGLASVTPETQGYFQTFWQGGWMPRPLAAAAKGFWPLPPFLLLMQQEGGQACLAWPLPWMYVALMFGGFWVLWRRSRTIGGLMAMPVLVAIAAAAARKYPLSDRLMLYLLPLFILAIAASIERLRLFAAARAGTWGSLVAPLLTLPALSTVALLPPPYKVQNVQPALAHLQVHRQPGDRIFVYYAISPGFRWYAPRYGFTEGTYDVMGCHRGDPGRYLDETDTLRGQSRVWIVLAHAFVNRERENIVGYLDAIGVQTESFVSPTRLTTYPAYAPVEVLRYDLSDPARLAAATAATFPLIQGGAFAGARYGCLRGPR